MINLSATLFLKMKINNINLKLEYNTFEKSKFDEYLIVSLILNTKDINEAYEYINSISGTGSLNMHFKKLYDNFIKYDKKILQKTIKDSLVPITKINTKNNYNYFQELNLSFFKGEIYKDKLESNQIIINNLVEEGELQKVDYFVMKELDEKDSYIVNFKEDKIFLKLNSNSNKEIEITETFFRDHVVIEDINIGDLKLVEDISGSDWKIVTNNFLNNLKFKNYFIENNNYYVFDDNFKKYEFAKIYGMYLYKIEIISKQNEYKNLIGKIFEILLENKSINEIKTKVIIEYLNILNETLANNILNYLLAIKESSELTKQALEIFIKNENTIWNKEAQIKIKKISTTKDLIHIYKKFSEIDYLDEEILYIGQQNKDLLRAEDFNKWNMLKIDYDKKIEIIHKMLGEMTASGIRERSKKIKSNNKLKEFHRKYNKLSAHSKQDISKLSSLEIEKLYKDITNLHELYKQIVEML